MNSLEGLSQVFFFSSVTTICFNDNIYYLYWLQDYARVSSSFTSISAQTAVITCVFS